MKRLLYILCSSMLLLAISLDARGEARLEVKFDKAFPGTLTDDKIVNDNNAEPTALVEIVSELDNLKFENGIFKVDKTEIDNGKEYLYSVYVLSKTSKIIVSHDEYIYAEIIFSEPLTGGEVISGIEVSGNKSDTETVNINSETGTYKVMIDYDDYADLYIDTQKFDKDRDSIFLEEGDHKIKVQYGQYSETKDINVTKNINNTKLLLSGCVLIKGVDGKPLSSALTPQGNAPEPIEMYHKRNGTYKFGHMLGNYHLKEYANTHAWVKKDITVGKRSNNIFRLDEMVGYVLIMYHGTHWQPLGLNVGYCKDFGGFVSISSDIRSSIDTQFGKIEFKNEKDEATYRSTSMTFSIGPMFKVVRKMYLQVGGGATRYLSTSEKKMLTGDYEYKWGTSLCTTFFYRFRNFMFGAGYTRQFLNQPFNSGWSNQINFSFGWAKGQN